MAACKTCEAPIIWATTAAGKSMPLDAGPTLIGGEWVLLPGGETRKATDEDKRLHRPLYTPHWATCNASDRWRKKR